MQNSLTIHKHPDLNDSSDYELLRKKGLQYIQELGSRFWTDYNIHDPGITLLELLSYAITDLGYRTSLDIKDLLATPFNEPPDPARQALYTAREILTTSPWTNQDYRKLLIDIDGVKNAWLSCRKCPCNDLFLYADCQNDKLNYAPPEHPVIIKGLYDVLVELEDEEGIGDLNSGKIKYNFSFLNGTKLTSAMIEMRLPSWKKLQDKNALVPRFMDNANHVHFLEFINPESKVISVDVDFISGVLNGSGNIPDPELGKRLRKPVYATMKINFKPDSISPAITMQLKNVALTVWFRSDSDRHEVEMADLVAAIEDASASGIMAKYLQKINTANAVILFGKKKNGVIVEPSVKQLLHEHRNLCEDYCNISAVEVQDVAVCADLDVEPYADIEAVLAEAYYLIDQYFSPDIKFYSLQQLMNENWPVDDIFDGPKLKNGFIKNDELEKANLKKALYASDVINLLMDIPGVKAVRHFVFSPYDDDGFMQPSETWVLNLEPNRQPRLYIEASKFLVFKNGLPFLPDKLELADTLQVIKGAHAQPKFSVLENDLPVPIGTWYDLREYHPLQYSLPFTYGVGFEGLPNHASAARRGQAKQLKAYLMFYEQLLVNYMEQLSHVKDLFSLSNNILLDGLVLPMPTYFSKLLGNTDIKDISTIYNGLTSQVLRQLDEKEPERLSRRNRFLDHLLARFAEQFNDYALMLYSFIDEKEVADGQLIKNKIAFLKDYPFMSYFKARSFNYKNPDMVCHPDNIPGLTIRIRRLLGIPEFVAYFELYVHNITPLERRWRLFDDTASQNTLLKSKTIFTNPVVTEAEKEMKKEISMMRKFVGDLTKYQVILQSGKWIVNLLDAANVIIATTDSIFNTQGEANTARDNIIAFAKKMFLAEKIMIVEHLLLRPRNKPGILVPLGDALLPVCVSKDCKLCGDEDPYSFRMTIVLNGESGIANSGIVFRRFAEQTIRMEVPAHLGVKICWVSETQLTAFETVFCAWLTELSKEIPDELALSNKLKALIDVFIELKSIYPPATLHDCIDGNDENPVFLDQSII